MRGLALKQVSLCLAGKAVFSPLDLHIRPGTVTSVVGPNGAGKSSLLSFVSGTLAPEFEAHGRVLLNGCDVTTMAPERRGIGILYQEPLLFPHLSVRGNLLFGLRADGGRQERRRLVDEELETLGLPGFGDRDPATLSGGQKARVALLRVLLSKPHALLLDEPFSSLDEATRGAIRQLVFDLVGQLGLPALLVTHDSGDVTAAAGPVIPLSRASG